MPAGTMLKGAIIESDGKDIKTDYLYITDTYNMEMRSDFQLMRKGGKYLIIPDESKKKEVLKSFKDYYRINSVEAFFFLYIPVIIISMVIWLLSGDSSLTVYLTVTAFSFITRVFLSRILGDIFLCLTIPSYIYLVLRF